MKKYLCFLVAAILAFSFISCAQETVVPISSIALEEVGYVLIGEKVELKPVITPSEATDKSVIWKSSDPEKVSVSDDGTVTGVSSGEAVITVTSDSAPSKTASITIEAVDEDVFSLSSSIVDVLLSYERTDGEFCDLEPMLPMNGKNFTDIISENEIPDFVSFVSGLYSDASENGACTFTVSKSDGKTTITCHRDEPEYDVTIESEAGEWQIFDSKYQFLIEENKEYGLCSARKNKVNKKPIIRLRMNRGSLKTGKDVFYFEYPGDVWQDRSIQTKGYYDPTDPHILGRLKKGDKLATHETKIDGVIIENTVASADGRNVWISVDYANLVKLDIIGWTIGGEVLPVPPTVKGILGDGLSSNCTMMDPDLDAEDDELDLVIIFSGPRKYEYQLVYYKPSKFGDEHLEMFIYFPGFKEDDVNSKLEKNGWVRNKKPYDHFEKDGNQINKSGNGWYLTLNKDIEKVFEEFSLSELYKQKDKSL